MKIGSLDTQKQCVIVAELGINHSGSIDIAKKSIKAAKEAGADAIKLQTYRAKDLTLQCDSEDFIIKGGTIWDGKGLWDIYESAHMPLQWHEELFKYAKEVGIEIFSTPFSKEMADFLEQFDPPAYKIASFELIDYELVEHVAKKQKPIIISTGIATFEEIQEVVKICKNANNNDIMLLKCTSQYPAPLNQANLKTILDMQEQFGVEIGFSDHTLGIIAPVVAATLGARLIEKHFILSKDLDSLDADFSITPKELQELVKAVKDSKEVLGEVSYELSEKSKNARNFARSLYVVKDIKKGDIITKEHIKALRPGLGLHPKYLKEIIGKKAKRDIKRCERASFDMFI